MATLDSIMNIVMPISVLLFFVFIIYAKLKHVIDPALEGLKNLIIGAFDSSKEKVEEVTYYGSEISYD